MRKLAYQQGQTLIHSLYPITKLVWLILITALIFIFQAYILWIISLLLLIILLSVHSNIWNTRGFRLAIATGLFLLIIFLVFDKSGTAIFDPGLRILMITSGGLESGLRFSGRFLSIIFLSYIFILTTDPGHLAYALMKIGLPYRYGFMMVTALRLAPVLENETQTIYKAQLVRGVQYDQGNLKKLFLLIQQFLTPLLISALQRADKLVFSMEGRGFGRYPQRTYRNQASPSSLDLFTSVGLFTFFAALMLINYGVFT